MPRNITPEQLRNATYTIFCHGSGRHRGRKAWDIVMLLHNCAAGQDYTNYLILDGVAGEAQEVPDSLFQSQHRSKTHVAAGKKGGFIDQHLMAGDYDPQVDTLTKKKGKTDLYSKAALLKGWGMGTNTEHAVHVLFNAFPGGGPARINLVGWSRGAVTCFRIANLLEHKIATDNLYKTKFQNTRLNVFAIDPVPGPGNNHDDANINISPLIHNLVVTLSCHDRRKGFKPVDLSNVKFNGRPFSADMAPQITTNHVWLPFYGVHNSCPQPHKPLTSPGQIVAQLAWRFLEHHGTLFQHEAFSDDCFPLGDKLVADMYAEMMNQRPTWEAHGGEEYSMLAGGKKITRPFFKLHMDKYVHHSGYFMNEHHRLCFLNAYPAFAQQFAPVNTHGLDQEVAKSMRGPVWGPPNWAELGIVPTTNILVNLGHQFWKPEWADQIKNIPGLNNVQNVVNNGVGGFDDQVELDDESSFDIDEL